MKKFFNGLGLLSAWLLVLIMVLMCAEVFCRYALNSPILGTVEISSYLLVFFVFCGTSYTQSVDGHIKIDLLTRRMSEKWQRYFRIASCGVALAVFALITCQTFIAFWKSWLLGEVRWGALALPIYPVKFIVAAGSLCLCVQLILDIVSDLKSNQTSERI